MNNRLQWVNQPGTPHYRGWHLVWWNDDKGVQEALCSMRLPTDAVERMDIGELVPVRRCQPCLSIAKDQLGL